MKFIWSKECQHAFDELKQQLSTAPVLKFPDFREPFELQTDASNFALGAVLAQNIAGKEFVVAYASRQLSPTECKYATIEKEALAIKWAVQHFRPYLYGRHFIVKTDHNPLRWLMNMTESSSKLARWALMLQEYDFEIIHRRGSENANADCLSRMRDFSPPTPKTNAALTIPNDRDQQTVINAQNRDKFCQKVKAKMRDPTAASLPSGISVQKFQIHNGILYWKTRSGRGFRLVIPTSMQTDILYQNHDVPVAGHLGFSKTVEKIKMKNYWPGLENDVKLWCRKCTTCQRVKEDNR